MNESVETIVAWIGTIVVLVLLLFVVLKCIWNFGVPYHAISIGAEHGVSVCLVLEILGLLLALVISWLVGLTGWLSVGVLSKWGVALIFASYLNFVVVAFIYFRWCKFTGRTASMGYLRL